MPSLDGPRANVERAKRHVSEFEAIASSLVISKTTHPEAISTEDDPETGNVIYKLVHVPPVPNAVALVAGDAIHRLRSALDLLMTQLVERVHQGTRRRQTPYFPFDRTREGFEARLTPEIQRLVGEDALDCLRAAEPYRGGKGEVAWYLHHLDVEDKHRVVYALGLHMGKNTIALSGFPADLPGANPEQVAEVNEMLAGMLDSLFWNLAEPMFPLKAGDVLFVGPPQPLNDPKFPLEIAFGEPQIVHAQRVLPTITEYVEATEALVDSFAPLLP